MPNPDLQPWAPDPDTAPGTPPVSRSGGERGSSSFPGNTDFNADYSPVVPTAVVGGPNVGTAYHPSGVSVASRVVGGGRSAAGSAFTVALTASSNTPVHAVAVTLTATVSDATATGSVNFYDGATKLGSAALASGVATYNVAAGFTTGAHALKAQYDGVYSSVRTVTAT